MAHTNAAYEEEPVLPSPIPVTLRYDMTLVIAPEYADRMYRDAFIAMAEVQAKKMAEAMVHKMVEDYDARKNPVKDDTVVS